MTVLLLTPPTVDFCRPKGKEMVLDAGHRKIPYADIRDVIVNVGFDDNEPDGARTGEEVMANIDVPETVRVWKIGVDQANVLSWNNYTDNQGYHLFCITNGKYLTWVKVPVGINLDFKPQGDNKTHFRLPDEQEREILSGESVALGIGGKPAFLYYKERDVGINLDWSESPKYEWRIFGADSELGKPIPENTPVALLNDKVQPEPDFLINFNRPVGSDIGWTTSPGFWDSFGSIAQKLAADAAKLAIKAYVGG